MSRFILFSFLILFVPATLTQAQTQNPEGVLSYKSSVWSGNKFYYNGFRINSDKVERVMRTSDQALQLLRQGNKQTNGASVIGGIGGILIGWPIGTAIAGGDPVWELAGVGAGISVVSAFIYSSANKKIKRSIEIYNSGTSTSHSNSGIREVLFLVKPDEVGFSFAF